MPNRRLASIPLLSWSFQNIKKFTWKLGCSPYQSGSCRKAFSKMSFQWKCLPPPPNKPNKFHNLACWQNKIKRKMNQLRKSDWELIKGKFVNTSESTSRSVLGLFMQLCKSTLTVSFHPLVSLRRKIYKLYRERTWQLYMPSCRKERCRRFRMRKPRRTVHEFAFDQSTVWFLEFLIFAICSVLLTC